MHPKPQPERNLLEAYFRGWSFMLVAIAATLLIVCAILWLSGMPLGWADFALPTAALGGAAILRGYERLARN